MRRLATLLMLLLTAALTAAERGKMPPLQAIVAVCHEDGFGEEVCNPAPRLAPIIGITDARLANGNTGPLWVTVAGLSFTSSLNDERFLLHYRDITGICADHTTTDAKRADERFITAVPQRHYFRITTTDREILLWVPGGNSETNKRALFYHAVLNQIVPVTNCDLRPTE